MYNFVCANEIKILILKTPDITGALIRIKPKMRNYLLSLCLMLGAVTAFAQPKADYYTSSTLDGKNGRELELALKAIVYPHFRLSYDDLWGYYPTTDTAPADSIPSWYTGGKTDLVYDMYAWMGQFPKFHSDNDHTQTGGINREHCVPNSWWGGKAGCTEAYSDLHHLVPSDGAANNAKGDYALGEYSESMTLVWPKATKTTTDGYTYMIEDTHEHSAAGECKNNASHVWKTVNSELYGGSVNVFEPADEYKGDFARMYLYVVCAYEGELTWQTNYMFESDGENHTTIKPWAKELLLKWHRQDPVSKKERDRNNAVESLQDNRNPFIDYPELVEYIWGDKSSSTFTLADAVSAYSDEYMNGGKKAAEIMLTFHVKLNSNFKGIGYTTNSNGTKSYTSSNTDVADVDAETGDVTIKALGQTIITFNVTETENFEPVVEKYGISVEE